MSVGQASLVDDAVLPVLNALSDALGVEALARDAAHARTLRLLCELDAAYTGADLELCAVPEMALALRVSEFWVRALLGKARLLGALPGALQAVERGWLSDFTSGSLAELLDPVELDVRLRVWAKVHARLLRAAEVGEVLSNDQLRRLVRRLLVQADPAGATSRRERAERGRSVEYRRRDDSLVDISLLGLTGPNGLASLRSIEAHSRPMGPDDPRTADQRRLDAAVDLLCGRTPLTFGEPYGADDDRGELGRAAGPVGGGSSGRCRAGCGCGVGQRVPCGVDVQLLVPLGAALCTTGEVAELVGHGPIEPDLLQELLLASPRVQVVFVDEHGVPVALGGPAQVPARWDSQSLRDTLLRLAGSRPPAQLVPRHPHDHPDTAGCLAADADADADLHPHPCEDQDEGVQAPLARPARSTVKSGRVSTARDPVPPAGTTFDVDVDVPAGPDLSARESGGPDPTISALTAQVGRCTAASPIAAPESEREAGGSDAPFSAPTEAQRQALRTERAERLLAGIEAGLRAIGGSARQPAPHSATHLQGRPGAYRPAGRLRRLLQIRSPRCEWPGCTARAARCDLDHDTAWDPDSPEGGPTCGCNLGPLCRHHHRVKQTGWTKTRTAARGGGGTAVVWTSRSGRPRTVSCSHQPPRLPSRPPSPVPPPDPTAGLSPAELEDLMWELDPGGPWFDGSEPSDHTPEDRDPPDTDRLGLRLQSGATAWDLDLGDTDAWCPGPDPRDPDE